MYGRFVKSIGTTPESKLIAETTPKTNITTALIRNIKNSAFFRAIDWHMFEKKFFIYNFMLI